MMAELLGRSTGYCRGKGGSMHIADFSIGMLGANGIVGGGFGLAAGAALPLKLRGADRVALCFFGDGAINQGAFHESREHRAIWKLPLVLLCENNQFAMSARVDRDDRRERPRRRAAAYGFPGVKVDGMDVVAVHEAVADGGRAGARRVTGRRSSWPSCYRFAGHFSGDTMAYRTRTRARAWLAARPDRTVRGTADRRRVCSTTRTAERSSEAAEAQIAEAIAVREAEPLPEPESAWDDVYA